MKQQNLLVMLSKDKRCCFSVKEDIYDKLIAEINKRAKSQGTNRSQEFNNWLEEKLNPH